MKDCVYHAKRELKALWRINDRIDSIYAQRERIQSLATKATSSFKAVNISGTGNRSQVEDGAIQMIELENRLDKTIDLLRAKYNESRNIIDAMENSTEQAILEMRYLEHPYRSWEHIMKKLYISEATSFRLHELALEHYWMKKNENRFD